MVPCPLQEYHVGFSVCTLLRLTVSRLALRDSLIDGDMSPWARDPPQPGECPDVGKHMKEKKTDQKPASAPLDKPVSERLTEAEKSFKQEGNETSGSLQKALDFFNRKR